MKRFTLTHRLLLLLVLPLAAVLAFGIVGAVDKYRATTDFAWLDANYPVFRQLSQLVHQLQKERGRAAVFVGSKGARFASELRDQQRDTDAALAAFRQTLPRLDPSGTQSKLDAAVAMLEQLTAKRQAIASFALTSEQSTRYFTDSIAAMIDLMTAIAHQIGGRMSDSEIMAAIGACESLAQTKEQSGVERAILSGVFSVDRFSDDELIRFSKAVSAQETFYRVFAGFATDTALKNYANVVQGPAVDAVAAMRQTAFDRSATGGFKVDPTAWYDATTTKIDLLKRVEDQLASNFESLARGQASAAWTSFTGYCAVTAGVVLLTAFVGVWTIRSITGPLHRTIAALTAGSREVSSAAGQVSSASQALADGSSEQAASLEETAASIEEINSQAKRSADNAQTARALADETRIATEQGTMRMDQMVAAMNAIKDSSGNIANIIKTIDEIAFQTNILALNAAVEAARAGEHGAGFAVVAEEVRRLAHRAGDAARETAEKIDDSIQKSAHGVAISGSVADGLHEIAAKARKMNELVVEIAAASNEQSQGLIQVGTAVTQIDRVTQSNAGSAEESAAAAEELNAQAAVLLESVDQLVALAGDGADRARGNALASADPEPAYVHRPPVVAKAHERLLGPSRNGHAPAQPPRFAVQER